MRRVISILYEGVEIWQDVIIEGCSFNTSADGVPGVANVRVKDDQRTYEPGYFHTGGSLELWIDGEREWDGWVFTVSRVYAFDVDDTSDLATPRFWDLIGYDRNLLFTRRSLHTLANPLLGFPKFPQGTSDQVVLRQFTSEFVDLSQSDIDAQSGIEAVASPDTYEDFLISDGPGSNLGNAFLDCAGQTGAIFYIGPDRILRYVDDETPTAPFTISDRPTGTDVGYREFTKTDSASVMANEAFVWGTGKGSPDPVFASYKNQAAIDEHGLFQWGDHSQIMFLQQSVDRRAESYVEGSPTHHRGHKLDDTKVTCTIFEPGIRVGMVVPVVSDTYGWSDNVPLRSVSISFPTPWHVRWDLSLSWTYDIPYSVLDPWWGDGGGAAEHPWFSDVFTIIGNIAEGGDPWPNMDYDFGLSTELRRTIRVINGGDPIVGNETGGVAPYSGFGVSSYNHENTPWFYTSCGVGAGSWDGVTTIESWYRVVKTSPDRDSRDLVVHIGRLTWHGEKPGIIAVGLSNLQGSTDYGAYGMSPDWYGSAGAVAVAQGVDLEESWNVYPTDKTRTADFGSVVIPGNMLVQGDNWVVLSPTWEAQYGPVCDPYYTGGEAWQVFRGTRETGQLNAGIIDVDARLTFDMVPPSSSTTNILIGGSSENGPRWIKGTHDFQTTYGYVAGTLEITLAGSTLEAGTGFIEVDPENGRFHIVDSIDVSSDVMARYQLRTTVPLDRDPGDPPPNVPTEDIALQPGVTGGKVYRPRPQQQYGWGTQWDGENCNCTSSAMALDRHSLGYWSVGSKGDPDSTPPNMRHYSGDYDFGDGTTQEEMVTAWASGWGQQLVFPGAVSWEYFLEHLNQGRGAVVGGQYYAMDSQFKFSSTFNGPHAIYINEQYDDGSFWGVDPLHNGGVIYPYYTLYRYMTSFFTSGLCLCSFTQRTPLV